MFSPGTAKAVAALVGGVLIIAGLVLLAGGEPLGWAAVAGGVAIAIDPLAEMGQ